jgi:hypothetical protein
MENVIKAKCIKDTYTWEKDGQQHKFLNVALGRLYEFEEINGIYWINCENSDFANSNGFIQCVNRGLEKNYFNEMFEVQ